jgi:hypothetical protein
MVIVHFNGSSGATKRIGDGVSPDLPVEEEGY